MDLVIADLPGEPSPNQDYYEDESGRQTRILKKVATRSMFNIPTGGSFAHAQVNYASDLGRIETETYETTISPYSYNFMHNPVFRATADRPNYPLHSPGQIGNGIDTFRFVAGLYYHSLEVGEQGKNRDKIGFANKTMHQEPFTSRNIVRGAFSGYQGLGPSGYDEGTCIIRIEDRGGGDPTGNVDKSKSLFHHHMATDYYGYKRGNRTYSDFGYAFEGDSESEIRIRLNNIAESVSTYGDTGWVDSADVDMPHTYVNKAKTADFVAALAKFPDGKIEHIELETRAASELFHDKTVFAVDPRGDDYWFYDCYTGYMRSGWSWRNYFHGFYPLVSPNYYQYIKKLRMAFGSREQIFVGSSPQDFNFIHPSERVSYNLLGPSNAGGDNEYPKWYAAEPNTPGQRGGPISTYSEDPSTSWSEGIPYPLVTYDARIEKAGTLEHPAPGMLPPHSTNLFPVIPFFGAKTVIPDELSSAAQLVNDYWGGPQFVATLEQLHVGGTARGSASPAMGQSKASIRRIDEEYDSSVMNMVGEMQASLQEITLANRSKYYDYTNANKLGGRSAHLPRRFPNGEPGRYATENDFLDTELPYGEIRMNRVIADIFPVTSRFSRHATFENKTFKDYVTAIPGFSTEYDLQSARTRLSSYIYVKGEYNYFDPFYENYINSDVDYYAFSGYSSGYLETSTGRTETSIVSRETILNNMPKLLPDPYSYNPLDPSTGLVGNRSRTTEELLRAPDTRYDFLPSISYIQDPLIFDINRIKSKQFKDIYLKRKTYPMHTEIEVLQSGKSILNELILSSGQSSITLTSFAEASKTERAAIIAHSQRLSEDEQDVSVSLEGTVRYTSLEDWSNSISFGDDYNTPLGTLTDLIGFAAFKSKLSNYCRGKTRSYAQIAKGQLAHAEVIGFKIEKYKLTTPTEAPENQFGARSAFTNRELIKSYYFAGDNTDDPTSFIDTQVEYGCAYEYEIYTICLIAGTEYAYLDTSHSHYNMSTFNIPGRVSNNGSIYSLDPDGYIEDYEHPLHPDFRPNTNYAKHHRAEDLESRMRLTISPKPKLTFSVISKPCPVISEVFARRVTVGILDKPPIPPDVNVVPFKNVPNRIRFNLNSVTGELFAKPVILDDDDYDQYWLSSMNQGLNPVDVLGENSEYWGEPPAETQLLHFKNDDQCLKFEVFRITGDRPTSWASFVGNKLPVISEGATSTSFTDTIATNVKYYYAFRSVDVHGHVSLPGHIHEVELRREEGRTNSYLLHNIYKYSDINKESRNRKSTFKRYLKIKPSLIQTEFPDLLENDFSYTAWNAGGKTLGTSNNPIWGKTVLYRVKSKATGKMVEIRVKFVRKDATVNNRGEAQFDE